MDEHIEQNNRPINPRRRKRSKLRIFKETYLPLIIAGVALLLIIIFIIGSITRAVQRANAKAQASINASIAAAEELERLSQDALNISTQATALAASFDYDGAIALINGFNGNIDEFPQLERIYQQCMAAKNELVAWEDPSKVINLSFQLLIADPERAFRNTKYGSSFLKNFITIDEFSRILQQLYENGYILVNMSDITDGAQKKTLYLPKGKQPLMITQTQVNYYTYMTDGDGDKLPDKNGAGFASKLLVDANGNITCEMVTSDGETVTGQYDLVPILESFIATHPDFSYKGARATLAVTGYDGIFGYRITEKAKSTLGETQFQKEVDGATQIVSELKKTGYVIACGTYENAGYGNYSAAKIQKDLSLWSKEILPVLGDVKTLVYARNSDIKSVKTDYSGDKFQVLQDYGFAYYLGFSTNGKPWFSAKDAYVRQGRILVSGSNLVTHGSWFNGIFDPTFVLDPVRENFKS